MAGPGEDEWFSVVAAHGILWLGILSMSVTFIPYSLSEHMDSMWFKISSFSGYFIAAWLYYCLWRAEFMDPGVLFREFAFEDEEAGFPSDNKILAEEAK